MRVLLVLTSVASVIIILFIDITGGIAAFKTLLGTDNTKILSYQYDAPTVPRYLKMHIHNRARQLDELATAATGLHRIMYVEPSTTDPADYSIAYTNCTSFGGYQDSDRLYADWYMLPLLQRMLRGMNSSIDLLASPMTHVVWIDCDYNGRLYQDTSMFKVYMVDVQSTRMTSFAMQTMNAMRSSTCMEVQVGAAIVTTATLSLFSERPDAATDEWPYFGLGYAGTSEYRTLVSLDFPYEDDTPFHDTYDDGLLPTNQYNWRIKATNETLAINGYSGYCRGSFSNQGNFLRYVIGMSGNPVRDFVVDFFASLGHSKDAWAWMQCLVIGFVAVRTLFLLSVAVVVTVVTWSDSKRRGRHTLPDLYSSVRQLIQVRALLILITFVLDGFWSIQEWMFTKALVRYNLLPMLSLGDGVRSDFLVLFLTWTEGIASLLRVSMPPIVPVVGFLFCYEYSEALGASLISVDMEQAVRDVMNEMYIRNLISYSPTGMNLWTRYRLTSNDPPDWLFATEFLWFFAPCAAMAALLVVYKCVAVVFVRQPAFDPSADHTSVPADKMHLIPAVPIRFLHHFVPSSTGVYGLVSVRPTPFCFGADAFELDKSNLWRAGWVVLNKSCVVCIDDLPNVLLNILAKATVVKVYCCAVVSDPTAQKYMLIPRLVPLFTGDLSLWSLLRLRLQTVWVRKLSPGEEQDATWTQIKVTATQKSQKYLETTKQSTRRMTENKKSPTVAPGGAST